MLGFLSSFNWVDVLMNGHCDLYSCYNWQQLLLGKCTIEGDVRPVRSLYLCNWVDVLMNSHCDLYTCYNWQ